MAPDDWDWWMSGIPYLDDGYGSIQESVLGSGHVDYVIFRV